MGEESFKGRLGGRLEHEFKSLGSGVNELSHKYNDGCSGRRKHTGSELRQQST